MMTSLPYTYHIKCPNGKKYYGVRWRNKVPPEDDLWKVYQTSSKYVKELIDQYNDDSLFVATVDKVFKTNADARAYEEKFLTENNCVRSDEWLNRGNGGKEFHFVGGNKLTEEHKKKLSEALKGENNPNYGKTGENNPNYGTKRTPATKERISEALKGKKNPMYGRTGENNPNYGKKHTPATKKKMSEAHKGIVPWNKGLRYSIKNKSNLSEPTLEKFLKE